MNTLHHQQQGEKCSEECENKDNLTENELSFLGDKKYRSLRASNLTQSEQNFDIFPNHTTFESINLDKVSQAFNGNCISSYKSHRRSILNTNFLMLRDALHIEHISRKTHFDSLLKKLKAKVFKAIHDAMKKCIVPEYKLNRLPQSFITNINIDLNKKYLEKTILEMYKEYEIFENYEEFLEKFIKVEKRRIFLELMDMKFSETFEYYVTSKKYRKDWENLKKKEGGKFSGLFCYITNTFLPYFTSRKGNHPKGLRKVRLNGSSGNSVSTGNSKTSRDESIKKMIAISTMSLSIKRNEKSLFKISN